MKKSWKCWLGLHAWKYLGQALIGGYCYRKSPNITVEVGMRTIYFRKCGACGDEQHYYPRGQELAAIIRAEQPSRKAAGVIDVVEY